MKRTILFFLVANLIIPLYGMDLLKPVADPAEENTQRNWLLQHPALFHAAFLNSGFGVNPDPVEAIQLYKAIPNAKDLAEQIKHNPAIDREYRLAVHLLQLSHKEETTPFEKSELEFLKEQAQTDPFVSFMLASLERSKTGKCGLDAQGFLQTALASKTYTYNPWTYIYLAESKKQQAKYDSEIVDLCKGALDAAAGLKQDSKIRACRQVFNLLKNENVDELDTLKLFASFLIAKNSIVPFLEQIKANQSVESQDANQLREDAKKLTEFLNLVPFIAKQNNQKIKDKIRELEKRANQLDAQKQEQAKRDRVTAQQTEKVAVLLQVDTEESSKINEYKQLIQEGKPVFVALQTYAKQIGSDDVVSLLQQLATKEKITTEDPVQLRRDAGILQEFLNKISFVAKNKQKDIEHKIKELNERAEVLEEQQKEHLALQEAAKGPLKRLEQNPTLTQKVYSAICTGALEVDDKRKRECATILLHAGSFATIKGKSLLELLVSTLCNSKCKDAFIKQLAEKELELFIPDNPHARMELIKYRANNAKDFQDLILVNEDFAVPFVEIAYNAIKQYLNKNKDPKGKLRLKVGKLLCTAAQQKSNKQWYTVAENYLTEAASLGQQSDELMLCHLMSDNEKIIQQGITSAEQLLKTYCQLQQQVLAPETKKLIEALLQRLEVLANDGNTQAKILCGFVYGRGIAGLITQQYDKAQQHLKTLVDKHKNPEARVVQLENLAARNSSKSNIKAAKKAYELASENDFPLKQRAIAVLAQLKNIQPEVGIYYFAFAASDSERCMVFNNFVKQLECLGDSEHLQELLKFVADQKIQEAVVNIVKSDEQPKEVRINVYRNSAYIDLYGARKLSLKDVSSRKLSELYLVRAMTSILCLKALDQEAFEQSQEMKSLLADTISYLGDVKAEDNPQEAVKNWQEACIYANPAQKTFLELKLEGVKTIDDSAHAQRSQESATNKALLSQLMQNLTEEQIQDTFWKSLMNIASSLVQPGNVEIIKQAMEYCKSCNHAQVIPLLEPLKDSDSGIVPILGISYMETDRIHDALTLFCDYVKQTNTPEVLRTVTFNSLKKILDRQPALTPELFDTLSTLSNFSQNDMEHTLSLDFLIGLYCKNKQLSEPQQSLCQQALHANETYLLQSQLPSVLHGAKQSDTGSFASPDMILEGLFESMCTELDQVSQDRKLPVIQRIHAHCLILRDFYKNPRDIKTSTAVQTAMQYLHDLADNQNDTISQFLLCQLYGDIQKNKERYLHYIEKAANNKQKYAPALYSWGLKIYYGEKDYHKAYQFFKEAGELDYKEAEHFMGLCLYSMARMARNEADNKKEKELNDNALVHFTASVKSENEFSTLSLCYQIALDNQNEEYNVFGFEKICNTLIEKRDPLLLSVINTTGLLGAIEVYVDRGYIQAACDLVKYYNFLISGLVEKKGRQQAENSKKKIYEKVYVAIEQLYIKDKIEEANEFLNKMTIGLVSEFGDLLANNRLIERLTCLKEKYNPQH